MFGEAADGALPWMLIPGLSPDAVGDPAYRYEAFCPITAETAIDARDTADFLDRAAVTYPDRVALVTHDAAHLEAGALRRAREAMLTRPSCVRRQRKERADRMNRIYRITQVKRRAECVVRA